MLIKLKCRHFANLNVENLFYFISCPADIHFSPAT